MELCRVAFPNSLVVVDTRRAQRIPTLLDPSQDCGLLTSGTIYKGPRPMRGGILLIRQKVNLGVGISRQL